MKLGSMATLESSKPISRPALAAKRWRRWLAPAGLLCTVFGLHLLAGANPSLIEYYYSRQLYPHIGRAVAFINKFLSFSLAEVLLLILLAGLACGASWQVRRLYLRRVAARTLVLSGLRGLLWAAGVVGLAFSLLWGLNYQRQPLAQSLDLAPQRVKSDELAAICRTIIAEINRNYEASYAGDTQDAPTRLPLNRVELYAVLAAAYERQTPLLGGAAGSGFGPPKPIYFSRLLSRFSIAGIYNPFTGEPNFNTEQPDCDLPFAIAHEMAHQRGYAREDEADFIAFLVCINSSHPYVRYSGYLHAMNVLGLLARVAPRRYNEVIIALAPGARADLERANSFWLRNEGQLSQATYKVTNVYLRVNQVKAGLKNYNEVVALIISYYLKRLAEQTRAPTASPEDNVLAAGR
jgi:Protein of unknown function (DUF3810)